MGYIAGYIQRNTVNCCSLLIVAHNFCVAVFGIGYGFVSGFITMPVILQQLLGPGNFGLQSQSQYFAVCSS